MSRYRRAAVPGGTYFFTVVTERRQPILTDPVVRSALREAIVSVRQTLPFKIDAWVLLPDHLHANPVKHGLVDAAIDWQWSSFHRWVRCGVYPPDWAGRDDVDTAMHDIE